ncbi:Hha toxicity modulator TomB [Candidatus Pantoea carbekii]|uniref:YbaJ protein n=1 Tax=Candidatus Pantoea carbekii TaxID=1235990 RepID=U3U3K7_9GAMM|nr:Hha toxicity modulator TomB [Candidatus Pantoea carbekii]AKC32221.1 putative biofilm regulator/cytoplasmic protein YbaJ [Candidatus Pantoea carbekii]BAO00756.1 YbaJ protein [Candidatus Pantoea carbekii]
MDEYSPKRHDIVQLKFLCEHLFSECIANLQGIYSGWVNDPASRKNKSINELIEYISYFIMNYKIKHLEDEKLVIQADEYLDDTFMLFSNYVINTQDIKSWKKSAKHLFISFVK